MRFFKRKQRKQGSGATLDADTCHPILAQLREGTAAMGELCNLTEPQRAALFVFVVADLARALALDAETLAGLFVIAGLKGAGDVEARAATAAGVDRRTVVAWCAQADFARARAGFRAINDAAAAEVKG